MANLECIKMPQDAAQENAPSVARADALITISEAARRKFASRATIQRAIKSGRISLSQDTGSEKLLHVAELIRVFGEPKGEAGALDGNVRQAATDEKSMSSKPLGTQVELMRKDLAHAQEQIARLKREREEDRSKAEAETIWLKGQVEATQRQLTDERGRSWWQRTFGGSK
jgi:hypothetical protein